MKQDRKLRQIFPVELHHKPCCLHGCRNYGPATEVKDQRTVISNQSKRQAQRQQSLISSSPGAEPSSVPNPLQAWPYTEELLTWGQA